MSPLSYVLITSVVIFLMVKLAYHLFHEIPRDREIVARRRGRE